MKRINQIRAVCEKYNEIGVFQGTNKFTPHENSCDGVGHQMQVWFELPAVIPVGHEQSCKKIIDLDLKDRDHLIDLDLFHDLDPY